jgi:hypothetical protein
VILFSEVHVYLFVLPLVVSISLVYAASRHESWPRIWWHSLRLAGWILGILVAITVLLLVINAKVTS